MLHLTALCSFSPHPGLQVLSHVSVFSPTELPDSWRLLQGVAWCSSTAHPHQISQCSRVGHKKIWWRTTLGGRRQFAVLQSQDRTFLSGEATAEEPISRGCLAQGIPEETPAPGGEEGAQLVFSAAVGNTRQKWPNTSNYIWILCNTWERVSLVLEAKSRGSS